jgi:serine phosphatase RsbU (regulator of sigma subunit)
MVADAAGLRPLGHEGSLPLGLGADPTPVSVQLEPGARLLLYTDGILEARKPTGEFVELDAVLRPLADGTQLSEVLPRVLEGLRAVVGGSLGDDLALLVAEYSP